MSSTSDPIKALIKSFPKDFRHSYDKDELYSLTKHALRSREKYVEDRDAAEAELAKVDARVTAQASDIQRAARDLHFASATAEARAAFHAVSGYYAEQRAQNDSFTGQSTANFAMAAIKDPGWYRAFRTVAAEVAAAVRGLESAMAFDPRQIRRFVDQQHPLAGKWMHLVL